MIHRFAAVTTTCRHSVAESQLDKHKVSGVFRRMWRMQAEPAGQCVPGQSRGDEGRGTRDEGRGTRKNWGVYAKKKEKTRYFGVISMIS
jgi:hypothetical protein